MTDYLITPYATVALHDKSYQQYFYLYIKIIYIFLNIYNFFCPFPVFFFFLSRGDDHANVCVLVPLTGIYRYVTGCDFLPIKQPKEVKLLSFNLAEQMPFMSNVRRINVDISRRLNDSPGLYGDSFGRKGAAQVAGGRWPMDGWTNNRLTAESSIISAMFPQLTEFSLRAFGVALKSF